MRFLYIFTALIIVSLSACKVSKDLAPDKIEQVNKVEQVKKVDKVVYDVVFRENLSGTYEKSKIADNQFEYYYTYADRGRGPKYTETITLNDQNYIVAQNIVGNNYRKLAVEENFTTNGNKASWKNSMETSSGDFPGDKLYFRNDGSPAIYEILGQLLLRSNTGKVNLYPEGQAELIKAMPIQLSNGASLKLLMIKGLALDPIYLWMSDDQLVCKISKNLHIQLKEFSPLRLEMKELQDAVEDDNLNEVAQRFSHKIDKAIIQDVSVFTADGLLVPNQDVFVEQDKITFIKATGERSYESDAQVISGKGKTLMPGLFDMHTHNDKFRGILHLAGGVTSVRDLANNKQLKNLAAQFDKNEILGPRIVTYCGIIDGPGKFANQRNVIQNLEEGLDEIDDYKSLGYQQIKLYSSIKPEWVSPLTKKAQSLGMRVSGHIPAYMTATQAIDQGYNEIQHINMVFLNFLSDTIDTRTPLRHTMPAQHGADLDLDSQEYQDFVKLLKSKDILIDPTISIFENMYIARKGEPSPTYRSVADRFPLMSQRSFFSGGLSKEGGKAKRFKDSFNKMLEVIFDLYEKGVSIVPGTDGLPGFLYHRELELYVKAGIPANEVLKIATIKSAEITETSDSYGSIEVGKNADLEWTMKGGQIYYTEELYNSLGIKHFK